MKRQNLRTVSLIVVTLTYLLIGAAIFGWLESEHEQQESFHLKQFESGLRAKYNISDHDYTLLTTAIIHSVPHKAGIQWKFAGAFYFATTVVTTIGYGHSTPSTLSGRTFCMVYALIGIPLGLVMFQSIGERLNTFVGSALRHVKRACHARNPEVTQTNLVMVVLVLSTILMSSMAAVFASYESWSYFDSLYYCFITLTTIGFGDYVALQKDSALQDNPKYVALSLIFILFGLSVVSSAVNLLVLKFLTLNTEDERRDEQLRYTAAMNPIQLEGDVITSPAGRVEYARMKRPALTLSQAMAGSAMMVTERQRRAIASSEMARSRPVLALTHQQLRAGARATAIEDRQPHSSGSVGSARSTDSSSHTRRLGKIHIQDSRRHRAEEDELRQVVGQRKAATVNSDELNCDDNDSQELRQRRPLDGQHDDDDDDEIRRPLWHVGRHMNKRWASNDKNGHEGEDDDDGEDGEEEEEDDEDDGESDSERHSSTCFHFHNNHNKAKLSADENSCVHAAHDCTPCPAHAHHHHNEDNTPVRYPVCRHDPGQNPYCHTLKCPRQQQQQHIVYVPSSQSFSQVHAHAHQHHHHHHQSPYYHNPPGGSQFQRSRCRACHNQFIPLEQAPLSNQLATIRTCTTSQRPQVAPDENDDHAAPIVELVMSAGSLGTPSPMISPTAVTNGQMFTYPDQTLSNHRDSQAVLMNARRRGRPACVNHPAVSLSRDGDPRYCNQVIGQHQECHRASQADDRRSLRHRIAPSCQMGPIGFNQSSCSCSWVSLSAAPARHHHTPTRTFHPATAAAAAKSFSAKNETSDHLRTDHRRGSQDHICKRTKTNAHDSQKSFVRSSPAVHEIDQRDERTAALFGQSASSASLRTPPATQPRSPTSTFDGGRPTSRSDRGRRSPPTEFTYVDSNLGAESPATPSTSSASTIRPTRRRSDENATPEQLGQVPRLVCKCCCQHAECIQYALSSETSTPKQEPAVTNVVPMPGNHDNNANTDKDIDVSAHTEVGPQNEVADCNQNPSELATSVRAGGDDEISDEQTQAEGEQKCYNMISGQPTGPTTTSGSASKIDQQHEDDWTNQKQ